MVCAFLVLTTVAVYAQSGSFEFTSYDDPEYLLTNPYVRDGITPAGVKWAFCQTQVANWHPTTTLSYLVDGQLWGLDKPGAFHFVNVLVHALNSVLLFLVLRRFTGFEARSAVVAALFALHPLHVESVAWVAERKDVLSALFLMLTIWAYAAWVARRSVWRYGLVVVFFALGLMSKPMLVTLPFVLLLLDVWPLKRITLAGGEEHVPSHRVAWTLVLEKVPLLGMSIASSIITFIVQQKAGALTAGERVPLADRIANAAIAYVAYLVQMVWPAKLGVLYPLPPQVDPGSALVCGSLLLVATIAALLALRRHPYVTVGWLWYMGTLIPVIGIVQVGIQARADRYTYIPLIGVFIAVVWTVGELLERRRRWLIPVAVATVAIIAALTVRTWFQVRYWATSESLYTRTLAVAPHNPQINYNLGTVYSDQQRYPEAIEQYREAVRLEPGLFNAWCNLALALVAQGGDLTEAAGVGDAIVTRAPNLADSHVARGIVAFARQDIDLAERCAAEALQRDERSPRAHLLQGKVYAARNNLPMAESEFRRATELSPSADAHLQLGLVVAQEGRTDEAIRQFREALKWQPKNWAAQEAFGHALLSQGKLDEALQHFSAALELNPRARDSRLQIARILTRQGKHPEATAFLKQVVAKDPSDGPARFQLGILLQQQHDEPGAVEQYRAAMALNPKSSARNNLAWILATSRNDQLRSGSEAVRLAEQLRQERGDEPEVLDTLAAALAEKGDFVRAVQVAEEAARRAEAVKNSALAQEIRERLRLYRGRSAYRE